MITLTEAATKEITRVMTDAKFQTNEYALRIGIAGGCSGIQYMLGFEKKEDGDPLNDVVYPCGEIEVRTNRMAEGKLQGTTIDFYEDSLKRGFVFNNPNVGGGCGGGSCGSGGCGSR